MTVPIDRTPRIGKAASNEARKAIATTANALSITLLVTLWLQPMLSGRAAGFAGPGALAGFIALQALAHYVLNRVED
ncbi:hypothetical protein ASD38_04320 [Caulobacter sp. Root487D2Y]|uniref:hypothetical protein n=1 Tax=Caulobacter sp. Root487D2Y TaxID=1736547 RepID=UPI0006F7CD9F|nr:hypothetical protein [Caulobacter sp. Root487D2Y]KQY35785.1 hypothetical protein ASD38_04320 [Caulobacter sp. Root487D2Y]